MWLDSGADWEGGGWLVGGRSGSARAKVSRVGGTLEVTVAGRLTREGSRRAIGRRE